MFYTLRTHVDMRIYLYNTLNLRASDQISALYSNKRIIMYIMICQSMCDN